jgi:hypothetical protein
VTERGRRRRQLDVGWFGTSLMMMEHYEANHPRLSVQADLPAIGDRFEVTEWRHRGYVHALTISWRASYPWITFHTDSHGREGRPAERSCPTSTPPSTAVVAGTWSSSVSASTTSGAIIKAG